MSNPGYTSTIFSGLYCLTISGNSAYLVVIQPRLVQLQSITYIYTIRRYRVLALMVCGPLLPSPIIRTRGGGVMIQTVEAVNSMSLSKGNRIWLVVEANCAKASACHPCANFYYNTWSFSLSSCSLLYHC